MPERTVLVVDDDRDLADVLADVLAEFGYGVECAPDGLVALEILERTDRPTPTAIVLDLLMPHMDGLEFLESLGENRKLSEIPVIVLSGEPEMAAEARKLEADVVLEKPVRLLLLVEAIRRVSKVNAVPGLHA